MARNYVQPGAVIPFTAGANLTSGQAFVFGSVVAVSLVAVANGAQGQAQVEGVFDLPKATGVVFTAGQRLNWRPASNAFTNVAPATGDIVGAAVAVTAQLTGDTTCRVRLSPGAGIVQP